ncbi:MAG: tetratricopeptide repeat protein [Myxococcales bacterium]|nr:tetratricopeptide repeat protein [Myxococcales bacterium]
MNSLWPSALLVILLAAVGACTSTTAKKSSTSTNVPTVVSAAPEQEEPRTPAVGEGDEDERQTIIVEPMRIEVVRDADGSEQIIARDARGLFDEANDALAAGDYERALGLYDEILEDFAESSLAPPAIYNAGLALEALERTDDAVARYLGLAARPGSGEEGIDARIRAAALLAEHERWSESLATLDDMLTLAKLSEYDRLEAMTRRGYVLLEAKDYAAAEKQLGKSIEFFKSKQGKRPVFEDDYFAAMAQFYLGDIPRRQFDEIPIRLPESQMERDLEAKASLLVLADERYDEVLLLRHPYWSTAAGYRKADMQWQFWRSLMRAPVPPQLEELAAQLYVTEVHKFAIGFLNKSLDFHGKNVRLAHLYKVPTQWSEASSREIVRLTELVGREQAGDLTKKPSELNGKDRVYANPEAYMPSRIDL